MKSAAETIASPPLTLRHRLPGDALAILRRGWRHVGLAQHRRPLWTLVDGGSEAGSAWLAGAARHEAMRGSAVVWVADVHGSPFDPAKGAILDLTSRGVGPAVTWNPLIAPRLRPSTLAAIVGSAIAFPSSAEETAVLHAGLADIFRAARSAKRSLNLRDIEILVDPDRPAFSPPEILRKAREPLNRAPTDARRAWKRTLAGLVHWKLCTYRHSFDPVAFLRCGGIFVIQCAPDDRSVQILLQILCALAAWDGPSRALAVFASARHLSADSAAYAREAGAHLFCDYRRNIGAPRFAGAHRVEALGARAAEGIRYILSDDEGIWIRGKFPRMPQRNFPSNNETITSAATDAQGWHLVDPSADRLARQLEL